MSLSGVTISLCLNILSRSLNVDSFLVILKIIPGRSTLDFFPHEFFSLDEVIVITNKRFFFFPWYYDNMLQKQLSVLQNRLIRESEFQVYLAPD